MNLEDLTVKQAKELTAMFSAAHYGVQKPTALVIGQSYLIRTVTMMYTGRLVAVVGDDLVLEDAAWIADSGRYHDALVKGTLSEVEPYPNGVIVSRGAMVDAAPWDHALPREQK